MNTGSLGKAMSDQGEGLGFSALIGCQYDFVTRCNKFVVRQRCGHLQRVIVSTSEYVRRSAVLVGVKSFFRVRIRAVEDAWRFPQNAARIKSYPALNAF